MVQQLYFEILRKKTHYFLDAKETTTIRELKLMCQGISKLDPASMDMWKCEELRQQQLPDAATMTECGFNVANAKAQMPAQIVLQIIGEDNHPVFEEVSVPPPIPDAMAGRAENAPVD